MCSLVRVLAVIAVCMMSVQFEADAAYGKSRDPIIIVLSSKADQSAVAHIVAQTLKLAGFASQFQVVEEPSILDIAEGRVHLDPAFATASDADAYDQALADAKIISLGGLQANGADEPRQKVIWSGFRSKWPYAERMLKTMIISSQDLEQLTHTVDAGQANAEQAAGEWMKNNKSKWKRWLSASTNWMKP